MKLYKWIATTLIVALSITGCNEKPQTIPPYQESEPVVQNVITSRARETAVVGTMSVKMTSSRNLSAGGAFVFLFTVKDGSKSVANAVVGIDDPISRYCTSVKTDANGNATYRINISSGMKPQYYAPRFYYGNQSYYEVVSITGSGFTNLSSYRVDMNQASYLSANNDGAASKVYSTNNSSNIWNSIIALNRDATTSYLKSPFNQMLVQYTTLTCTTGQAIPAYGQVACLTGVRAIAIGYSKEVVKIWVKSLIQKSNLSASDKVKYSNLVDASNAAIGLVGMDFKGGLVDKIDSMGSINDVVEVLPTLIDSNTFCLNYKRRSTNTVYSIGICKR